MDRDDIKGICSNRFNQGFYTLIISLSRETLLPIGKLGVQRFQNGYYTYTGSALGKGATSLRCRVSRHLRKEKPKRWHIDFLLAHENAAATVVVAAKAYKKMECDMNRCLKQDYETKIPVLGFGASDCKENCESHLLYYPNITKKEDLIQKIVECARLLSEEVCIWRAR